MRNKGDRIEMVYEVFTAYILKLPSSIQCAVNKIADIINTQNIAVYIQQFFFAHKYTSVTLKHASTVSCKCIY